MKKNLLDLRVWTSGHQVNIEGNFKTFTVSSDLKGVYILKISDGDKGATQKVFF
jgi:hypothetical protein